MAKSLPGLGQKRQWPYDRNGINRYPLLYKQPDQPTNLFMDILVFKTNLDHPELLTRIEPFMQTIPGIKKWNIDMDDCDNVLRIESEKVSPGTIESVLQQAGYFCEELRD